MLQYTGHPLVDVGVATITAFAGKKDPAALTEADLEAIADYMARNYVVNPLKSFLNVAFPNSGFTQPAFEKQPERREAYAERVLRAFGAGVPRLEERCVFTGLPAVGWVLKDKDDLPPGRAFRQHIPLLTGEGVINFFPQGDAGLPVSGEAILALQALPLGCAKVAGRLLAVHSSDPDLTLHFARQFLAWNRKAILTAQKAGEKKLPQEKPHRPATLLVDTLLDMERQQPADAENERPVSLTAYHLSNSGQGVDLQIYHLPLETMGFLRLAMTATYRQAWSALCQRGWEVTRPKRGQPDEGREPRYNVLYEDLFQLPGNAAAFIRCYFLRVPRRTRLPGDPSANYSITGEAELISWPLTALFLRKVVNMNETRIQSIRELGDRLARYVNAENDRRFFYTFMTARRYEDIRIALIRSSVAEVRQGRPPLVAFDPYIEIFEEGSELPYTDWRLARDLVLIRMVESLYGLGWLQRHKEELPEPEELEETVPEQARET
ncbi:MAG: type I-B CRISPR-associated protein Cas8b1/Cst1 [Anaerolineae bacterium]